jgi:hypothetical protein
LRGNPGCAVGPKTPTGAAVMAMTTTTTAEATVVATTRAMARATVEAARPVARHHWLRC